MLFSIMYSAYELRDIVVLGFEEKSGKERMVRIDCVKEIKRNYL